MSGAPTLKVLMDIKTKKTWAVSMDAKGKVLDVKPVKDTPPWGSSRPPMGMGGSDKPSLAGTKTYCVDISAEETSPEIWTLVWPKKVDVDNARDAGKPDPLPHVGKKMLPQDLIKAGIATLPDTLKTDAEKAKENDAEIAKAMENINKLIGLGEVKDKLQSQIKKTKLSMLRRKVLAKSKNFKLPESDSSSMHMVFSGNPGTGKTTVAREYGKMLKALGLVEKGHIHEVLPGDLIAGYVGQTAGQTRKHIEQAMGGVLFIDEAYGITNGVNGEKFGNEAIDEIVAAMENHRDDLVIIVAGYPDLMSKFISSNPGLKRRFVNYLNFADYDGKELSEIMDLMAKDHAVQLTPEAKALAVKKIEAEKQKSGKNFGNAGTVRNVIELALENMAARVMEGKSINDFNNASQKELEDMVTTITAADIKKVDLDGVKGKGNSGGPIGFNFSDEDEDTLSGKFGSSAAVQVPSNDDVAPSPAKSAPRRPGVNR